MGQPGAFALLAMHVRVAACVAERLGRRVVVAVARGFLLRVGPRVLFTPLLVLVGPTVGGGPTFGGVGPTTFRSGVIAVTVVTCISSSSTVVVLLLLPPGVVVLGVWWLWADTEEFFFGAQGFS